MILVTGGSGYIGTALTSRLAQAGYAVRTLDLNEPSGLYKEFLQGDIRNLALLGKALKSVNIVIHLAAVVPDLGDGGSPPPLEPMEEINNEGACLVAEVAKDRGVPRFIFTSTCSAYGAGIGLDEKSPLRASIPYATSKIAAEHYILPLADADFHPTILRLATVFGPSKKMGWHTVFNGFVRSAIRTKKLDIYNPGAYRPFVSLDDVIDGIIMVMEAPAEDVSGEVFNVGGTNCTKAELASLIKEYFPETAITIDDGKKEGYTVFFGKIVRLGFKIKTTPREGIRQFADIYGGQDEGSIDRVLQLQQSG